MTYKEMEQICSKNNGKCKNCILNCLNDWTEKLDYTWCLKSLRKAYTNKYKMWLERDRKDLAEQTALEYAQLERKYLGK